MKPIRLAPNQPPRSFDGGAAIAAFRGLRPLDRRAPEDWIASATTLYDEPEQGLTRLPDGRWLRDAMSADPEGYLGPDHAAAWGGDPALLIKLLDAKQRLPVHVHPNREFARRHLDCPYGKTEAWVVLAASGPRPVVHLGFRDDVEAGELAAQVEAQDTAAILAAMNEVPVAPGDAILVPAGLPHAIGAGVFVLELQEPTDFSILLEWDGFDFDGPRIGHLGLGFDVALESVDRSGWPEARLRELSARRPPRPGSASTVLPLFPAAADPYFRADLIGSATPVPLEPGFSVITVLAGSGELTTQWAGDYAVHAGDILLVPYGAGTTTLTGPLEAVRCRPPDPADAETGR